MTDAPAPNAAATPNAKGCGSGGACTSGGCAPLPSQDWLAYEGLADLYPASPLTEVRFKGGRKEFFKNLAGLPLVTGDPVQVDTGTGRHIGYVSLTGPLVELQMRKKKVDPIGSTFKQIYKVAETKELDGLAEARNRELPTLFRTRQLVDGLKLPMKVSDVEYQADLAKATFYYSSEERIDFRELVRVLATEFKVKVEMRQITLRQEAGRIGGIGVCGRELCCSTWLTDFKTVGTSAARYQNLSLNPAKLSGQCGRLKCCLNYELDSYISEMADMPKVDKAILTGKGDALLQKTDIFRKKMWFAYKGETVWHELDTARVRALQQAGKAGKPLAALTEAEERALANPDDARPLNHDLASMDERFKDRDRQAKRERSQRAAKAKAQSAARPASQIPQGPKADGQAAQPAKPSGTNPKRRQHRRPKKGGGPPSS